MNVRLRAEVERLLERKWAPEQIAGSLALTFPDDPEMRVSHETIYQRYDLKLWIGQPLEGATYLPR